MGFDFSEMRGKGHGHRFRHDQSVGLIDIGAHTRRIDFKAMQESRHLREVLADEPLIQTRISAPELEKLMNPANYLGETQSFIDGVLAAADKNEK